MALQQNEGHLLGIHRASPAPHRVDPDLWFEGSGSLHQHQAQGNYFPLPFAETQKGPSRNDGEGGVPGRVTPCHSLRTGILLPGPGIRGKV